MRCGLGRPSQESPRASDPASRPSGRRACPRLAAGRPAEEGGLGCEPVTERRVVLGRTVRSESLVRGDFRPRVSSVWERVASGGGRGPPAPGVGGVGAVATSASGRVAWPRHTAPLVGTVPLSRGPRALPGAAAPPSSRSVDRPCPLAILWESVAWGQGRGRRRLQGSRGPGPRLATPPAAGDLALPQDAAHLGVLTRETGADARGGGRLAEPCFLCLSRRRGSSRAALHAASGPGKLLRCGACYS